MTFMGRPAETAPANMAIRAHEDGAACSDLPHTLPHAIRKFLSHRRRLCMVGCAVMLLARRIVSEQRSQLHSVGHDVHRAQLRAEPRLHVAEYSITRLHTGPFIE